VLTGAGGGAYRIGAVTAGTGVRRR
jgi:hypothetical protein